jgi:hypothetical protein
VLQLANKGYLKALEDSPALLKGLNIIDGKNLAQESRRGIRVGVSRCGICCRLTHAVYHRFDTPRVILNHAFGFLMIV